MGGGGGALGNGYAAGGGGQSGGNGEDDAGGNNGGYSLPGGTNQLNTAGADGGGNNVGSVMLECLSVAPACTAPTVTCPSSQTVVANGSCQAALPNYTSLAAPSGGCGTVTLSQSPNIGSTLNLGPNTVVITATDDNSNTGTCSFTVTVADQTAPTISCPANATVSADGSCGGVVGVRTAASSSDNCGTPTVSQSPGSGTTLSGHNDFETVVLTATDGVGNTATCSFTVTLKDVAVPSVSCPADATVSADGSCGGVVGVRTAASSSDNCGTPTVTQSPASGTMLSGHNDFETVVLTATDAGGNTATCSFTVTLKDVAAPTVVCQNATVNLGPGGTATLATINTVEVFNFGASVDNCGFVYVQSVSPNTFDCDDLGQNTVTLSANDGAGNVGTCTATVTITDAAAPSITCPSNTTVAANGGCGGTVGSHNATSVMDDCGTPTVTQSPASGTVLSGHNDFETVTLTATDDAGNTSTCSFTVTLKDVTPPTPICKTAHFVLDANGNASLAAAALNDGSSDNCTAPGSLGLAVSPNFFDCDDAGENTVVLTVTDANANTASCTATVTVLDVLHYSETPGLRTASDGLAGDNLGWGLGLSGGIAIAGAPNDKVGTQNKQGSAYVFLQNQGGTDNWGQLKQIKAFNGAAVDYYGNAVSVEGNTAAIAAHGFNHPLGGTDVGTVYIYEKDLGGTNNWGFRTGVGAFDGAAYDYFGSALSLKDDVVAVGANKKKVGANSAQGAVYLYQKDVGGPNNWSHVDKVVASDGGANNFFGQSVSQSNDFLLVGAPGNLSNRGAAYVFWHPANYYVWAQQQKLTASDAAVGDGFGTSVSVSNGCALVGAPNKATYAGAAYVFKNNAGTWSQAKKLTASDGAVNDRFGTSVALQGDYAYVSALRASGNAGAVYVFHKDAGGPDNWGQIGKYSSGTGASGDQFGYTLGVSGDMMAVGANLDDVASKADQGSIYIFTGEDCGGTTRPGSAPSQSRALTVSPSVQCSPNPFRDELTIEISQSGISNLASEIRVMDAVGRQMARVELPAGQTRHTLKTNGFRAGMYFVQVSSEAGVQVVPVVLIR